MIYNTPVSSSGIKHPSVIPAPTMLNNVCHNSEGTILTPTASRKILETNRPDKKGESVDFCRANEKRQVRLKIVTTSSPIGQTCHRILRNSPFNNYSCVNYGLIQQHGTCPESDSRLYRTASLDNFTAKPEHSNNQIQHVPCCHANQKHKNCDKRVERRLKFSQGLGNSSWTTGKVLLVLLLLVDLSSALSDKELSVMDINSARQSPCLLHFPTTTLVYARHPYNCSIFYLCYAFKQWEMICNQANTVFSLKHRVCVWKNSNLDDCQDNSTEVDYILDQTFPSNVDDTNNKQVQFSNIKRIDTKLDSQHAILTRQPFKKQNWEIRRKETLKDNVADFYDELKKDKANMLQEPAHQGVKQEIFNSELQMKHNPESWYTFMISNPQTLDKSVRDLPVKSSTIDFLKEAQTSFHNTNQTTPFNLEERDIVADSNMFIEDVNSVSDGEEVLSDDGKNVLQGTRQDSMSGENKDVGPDAMKDVLSSEIEDTHSTEMADVLPVETVGASPDDIDNELLREVNKELSFDRIDYTGDKADLSFLGEAEHEHKDSLEVRIEGTGEKTISPEEKTNYNVHTSGDFATNISHFGFTDPDIVSSHENVDQSVDSIEAGEAIKLNEDTVFLTTIDRDKADIKSTVTVSKIRMNTIPQFQLPVGEFLEAVDSDLTPDMQQADMETLQHLDPPLINGIELSLHVHREDSFLNESANIQSVGESESKVRSGLDSYAPEQSWLNMPKAQSVDLNNVEVTGNELERNNYVINKQLGNLVDQNVKPKNVPFQDITIPIISEYFQKTITSDWNKLGNPKLDIHLSNYQKDHEESKQQPNLTTKQHLGEEYLRNEYQHWNNSTVVQKYGEPKHHQLETARISPESTLVVRPWQGLSNQLRIPATKYKLFNGLYVKGLDQGKYVDDALLSNVVLPRQLVNTHIKTTKLSDRGLTIKKQIKSISEKVHRIADKISNIFWLNPKSATPILKNQTFVKMVNRTKMSPKQDRGKRNFHKSPMWFLKSRYINTPLARPTYKVETPQENKDSLGYALMKPRQHKNKSRRMRIISKKTDNIKMAKRLKIKTTKKQNKNVQQKGNQKRRSKNKKTFFSGINFIPGRHNKDTRDLRFIAGRNNKESKDGKFISRRNNFQDAREVKFIPGRDENLKREKVNYHHGKQLGSIDDKAFNPDHSQDGIMPKYYRTYLQQKMHHLLQHLQHPYLDVQKKDNSGYNGPLKGRKQSQLSNHGPLKETKQTPPSKHTAPKISGSEKLLSKSSLKLGRWKHPQYIVPKLQLPQLGIQSDENAKFANLYSETDVNSQHINKKRISSLRTLNQIHKSDEESTKKYHSSKQESTKHKTTVDMNAIDDLYLGNIIDGSVINTDNPQHDHHTLGKIRNKADLTLEDLKIDSLPKLFIETKWDVQDWEKNRGFSNKILARPKMSLPGQTTTTTVSVYPPSTNQPSSPPATATTTITTPTTTTARTAVSPTNLPDKSTLNTTTTSTAPTHRPPTQHSDVGEIPEYRKELKDRCGIMATPLIIGGRKSRAGQWPWQVSLQIVSSTTPWHRCGGVLVHARWVLTAAHCVEGPFYGDIVNWRVVMADYDLDSVSGNEIYRSIRRVISHPDYVRSSNFPNDVALLELDSPVDLTSGDVQTACLPDTDFPLSPGTKCWISGWGETRGSGGKENVMNEVPVDVMSHDQCKPMWGRVDIDVLDSQVCLGYGDTGACYGDSGGPLMCESQGRFYVAGVMSWLINNCSANNFPNVFTRLPNYMDWLYKELDYFEWFRHL